MFKRIKKYLIFILPLFFAVISFNNVSAARTSNDDLYKKSLVMGIKTCYNSYAKNSIAYKDFSDYTSIFEGSGFSKTSSGDVWITTHVGNNLNSGNYQDSNLSCAQVFAGYKSQAKGLKDYYTIPADLAKLGYEFSHVDGAQDATSGTAAADTDQITLQIDSVKDSSNSNSNKMQVVGSGISCNAEQKYHNGWIFKYYYWQITGCSGKTGISYNGEELFVLDADINDGFLVTGTGAETFPYNGDHFSQLKYYTFSHTSEKVSLKSEFDKTNFLNMLKTDAETAANKYYSSPSATVESTISTPKNTDKTNPNSIYRPKDGSKTAAANALIRNLGASALTSWTANDKYSLYYQYLLNIQKTYPDININQCSTEKPSSGYAFKNSPTSWCIINIPTSSQNATNETLSVFGGSGLTQGTFQNVLGWFNNENNYNGVSKDTYANAAVDENGDLVPEDSADENGDEKEATCLNSGGAGTLGWIVCPILESLGGAAEQFYDGQIKNQLQIEPELFTGGNGGTKRGWETFRTLANTLFIILFLVVIFSQLTGVGINNYGIKKILPKLIIAAILINLSYLICVALVDVSNILGNSLQTMFNSLGEGLTVDSTVITSAAAEKVGSTLASVVIIGVLVGATSVAIWANPAIILTLLISALGVVISLLFLFVLLSVRQAAIVVLVVLSPLVVVAYALPNTKTLFDKWWKLFKSLLLVYPITGLLVGGGNYVSRLLLSSGLGDKGVFEAATAMIAGIVPVFFIPTVLKNSLAAMGTLGTKLSGMGAKASGWATKKATNSDFNKNIQEMGKMRSMRIKGGIDKDGNPVTGKRRGLANLMSGGNRMRRKNALAYQSMLAKEGSLDAADGPEFMLATQTANVAKELAASGEINNMNDLRTGLSQSLVSGDRARIRAYTDALTAKGEDGRNAVKQAYNGAVGHGMSSVSAKTFSDNIMANHAAEYKNNNRAMFEVVKNINAGGAAQTTGDFLNQVNDEGMSGRAKLATKATSSTLANMDDEAFDEVFNGGIPAGLDAGQSDALGATIYTALNDQNANIKTERRQKLEELLAETGYTPQTQNVNVTNDVINTNANITNDVLDVHETVRNYRDAQGNVYEVRRTQDGRHTDQSGFDVQIDPSGRNGLKPM